MSGDTKNLEIQHIAPKDAQMCSYANEAEFSQALDKAAKHPQDKTVVIIGDTQQAVVEHEDGAVKTYVRTWNGEQTYSEETADYKFKTGDGVINPYDVARHRGTEEPPILTVGHSKLTHNMQYTPENHTTRSGEITEFKDFVASADYDEDGEPDLVVTGDNTSRTYNEYRDLDHDGNADKAVTFQVDETGKSPDQPISPRNLQSLTPEQFDELVDHSKIDMERMASTLDSVTGTGE